MNKTQIPWVKNPDGTQGYTWNPITGCLNQKGGLCNMGQFPCYAYRLANTRLRGLYLANHNVAPLTADTDCWYHDFGAEGFVDSRHDAPFYPRLWEDRVDKISMSTGGGKGIFVCDMSDLFGIGIPEQWTNQVLKAIEYNPSNRFYLLTKQPQNLIKYSPFPDNCYVGVTATNEYLMNVACTQLEWIKASVKFLSLEPLLSWNMGIAADAYCELLKSGGINWAIIGACTGTRQDMEALCHRNPDLTLMPFGNKWSAQPKIEWVREIVEAADKAGVKVFLKDNLGPLLVKERNGQKYAAGWANGGTGTLRQEIPIS